MPKEIFMIVPGTPHCNVSRTFQQGLLFNYKYLGNPNTEGERFIGHVPLDPKPYIKVEVCPI